MIYWMNEAADAREQLENAEIKINELEIENRKLQISSSKPVIKVTRYHDFSCGHRVVGHEGKCRHLHGHNYRVTFECTSAALDDLGRVIDFGVIKSKLCQWLEDEWDHRMLLWEHDPLLSSLIDITPESIVIVSFNPTAENIALHLLNIIGPLKLEGTEVILSKVIVEETRKCTASAEL